MSITTSLFPTIIAYSFQTRYRRADRNTWMDLNQYDSVHVAIFNSIRGLKDRQRVDRRTGSALDGQWCKRDHELIAVQPPRRIDGPLEVEILHDADAHRLHDHPAKLDFRRCPRRVPSRDGGSNR